MKENVRPNGNPNRFDCREAQRHRRGYGRYNEIDRGGAVMAEREADLAIVVRQDRRRGTGWRGGRQGGRRAARRKRKRVVMPTEQHRLQEDRENPESGDPAS
jgi:hypothetical protein